MKKILLIEDRSIRQQFFTKDLDIDLNGYSDILDNCINELYLELELQLKNGTFNFDEYDYIISHKSAFGQNNSKLLERLKGFCKLNKKTLILFSGGISSNYYDESEFKILELNSKTFYSKNLKMFLEAIKNDEENILMLCYGRRWKQNIVSNIIETINIFIDRNDSEDIDYVEFTKYVDVKTLVTIKDNIYTVKIEDGWIFLEEIRKLRDSLYKYLQKIHINVDNATAALQKNILVHNNNIVDLHQFSNRIKFTPDVSDIDDYISKSIIWELRKIEFDVIYIKDNLSSNYLDLYGIRLAYHIRLTKELERKKYIPIIILSDFTSGELNKIEPMANILFTKNIYLISNTKEAIDSIKSMNLKSLTMDEYKIKFLDQIKVEQPKDYLSHHSIANEWSMYRWSEYLNVHTNDIEKVREDISSMLYFKYLQAKFPVRSSLFGKYKQSIQGKGKVLFIDDEWKKGWRSIFENISPETDKYKIYTIEENYKDKSQEEIFEFVLKKVNGIDPDVVILDMRLHDDDFKDKKNLSELSGIQVFNKIKKINPGIQVIIFTASNNSLLLEELYSYDESIIGYVKKEHPENYNLMTQGNINKLIKLIDTGLENKYLKQVWIIKEELVEIFKNDPFKQYVSNKEEYDNNLAKLIKEANYIFDILCTPMKNKFNYALLSIATSIDALQSIFIKEYYDKKTRQKDYYYLDQEISENVYSLPYQILYILKKSGYVPHTEVKNRLFQLNSSRNNYIHSNTNYIAVTKEDILIWFKLLFEIVEKLQTPTKNKHFDKQIGSISGLQSIRDNM